MLAIGLGMMQFCSEWLSFLGCCPCEAMPVAGFKTMKGQPTAYRELRSDRGHKSPLESHLGIPCHFLSVWAILLSCMNTAWTGERVYLELGKNVPSHNLHILSTHWPELGSEKVGSLQVLKGPCQPHLQWRSTTQANSCLKFNPKREEILHVASLDLGFSSTVPVQISLKCWL